MRKLLIIPALVMVICSLNIKAQDNQPKLNQVELSKKLTGVWQEQNAKDTVNGFEMIPYKNAVLETAYRTINGVKELTGTCSFTYDPASDKFKGFFIYPDGQVHTYHFRFSSDNEVVFERVQDFKTNKLIARNKFVLPDPEHMNGTHYNRNEVKYNSSEWVKTVSENPKVLLYIQDNSADLGYMLTNEAGKMKEILEQSGFDVITASISGEVLKAESATFKPDIKLSEVNINDYAGFIMPCMAINDTIVTSGEKSFVRKVVNGGKPIAAQNGAVLILAKAGVLNGKKFAIMKSDIGDSFPEFKNGIYSGIGVVRDGNIITSGTCPMMAKETGNKDGTEELTQKLVQAIKAKI